MGAWAAETAARGKPVAPVREAGIGPGREVPEQSRQSSPKVCTRTTDKQEAKSGSSKSIMKVGNDELPLSERRRGHLQNRRSKQAGMTASPSNCRNIYS